MARRDTAEELRSWVGDVVRSGLGSPEEVRALVVEAIVTDLRAADAERLADDWIASARAAWVEASHGWPSVTDHDRLQEAFVALERVGVVVLQGCADHWSARDRLLGHDPRPRGIAWFTAPDVWHAVGEGMLEVNLWHGTTANAAPGDALLDDVLSAFAAAGLAAHFDEGRVEVAARWQRRPA